MLISSRQRLSTLSDTLELSIVSDLHLIQSSHSHDLEKLSKWLVFNRLTSNGTKTEFILIGSRQRLSTTH